MTTLTDQNLRGHFTIPTRDLLSISRSTLTTLLPAGEVAFAPLTSGRGGPRPNDFPLSTLRDRHGKSPASGHRRRSAIVDGALSSQ
jgi:hypothetical protein